MWFAVLVLKHASYNDSLQMSKSVKLYTKISAFYYIYFNIKI